MAEEEGQNDKPYEPSQKKLDDARRKGDIPRSVDLLTFASYLGLLLALIFASTAPFSRNAQFLSNFIRHADELGEQWFSANSSGIVAAVTFNTVASNFTLFFVPGIFCLLFLASTRGFTFSSSKISLKIQRVSLVSNAQKKFGISGIFEFAKSTVKLTLISSILSAFIFFERHEIFSLIFYEPTHSLISINILAYRFFTIVTVIAFCAAILDYIFQNQHFKRKNRMSHKELADEAKQSEGDPHMKRERRHRAFELANRTSVARVSDADVLIVNPTHFAVALKWSRQPGTAPTCVAKGVDYTASRMREIAIESAVPIHSDPPTARALYASVAIDQEVRPEHYKAVAAAIRVAEKLRQRERKTS